MNDPRGKWSSFTYGPSSSVCEPRRSRKMVWLCRYCGNADNPQHMLLFCLEKKEVRDVHEQQYHDKCNELRHNLHADGEAWMY